jgi:hypothetical protein
VYVDPVGIQLIILGITAFLCMCFWFSTLFVGRVEPPRAEKNIVGGTVLVLLGAYGLIFWAIMVSEYSPIVNTVLGVTAAAVFSCVTAVVMVRAKDIVMQKAGISARERTIALRYYYAQWTLTTVGMVLILAFWGMTREVPLAWLSFPMLTGVIVDAGKQHRARLREQERSERFKNRFANG